MDYEPVSYISFSGYYHEVFHRPITFITDLNGALKWVYIEESDFIVEAGILFKRTQGGKWIFYDSSLYSECFDLTGIHYLPVSMDFSYGGIQSERDKNRLKQALSLWDKLLASHYAQNPHVFFFDNRGLLRRDLQLRRILKGTIPVIPPEAVFVDYDVIPVLLSHGCLSNCSFCCVKTGGEPTFRPISEVKMQIRAIKEWIGQDGKNYSTVFFGQNDALSVDTNLLEEAAYSVFKAFSLKNAYIRPTRLMMFGSPISLLEKKLTDFSRLDSLPFDKVHINVGIESLDDKTLNVIGRPFGSEVNQKAIRQIHEIHESTQKIEVSINFLIGPNLPQCHFASLSHHLQNFPFMGKGCVFVSPLFGEYKGIGQVKRDVFYLKALSKVPVFLYLLVSML
ncbi:MAG: radical SAM protein [Deltaproteobacteria bacterium]